MSEYLYIDQDDFKTVSSNGTATRLITGGINHCIVVIAFSVEPNLKTITLGHFASTIGRREKLSSFLQHLPLHHKLSGTIIATFGGQIGVIEDENQDYVYDSSEMLKDIEEGLANRGYKLSYKDVLVKNRHIQRIIVDTKGSVDIEMGVFGESRQIPATYTKRATLFSDQKTNFVTAWLQQITAPSL